MVTLLSLLHLLVGPPLAPAVPAFRDWTHIYVLCLDVSTIDIPKPIPHPVGCEILDCCPGCPGPGELEWRIRLNGERAQGVLLHFENISKEERNRLRIGGSARWTRAGDLQIDKGEATIAGFRPTADGVPPVAIPRPLFKVEKGSRDAPAADYSADAGTFELKIDQLLGKVVVNEYAVLYRFRYCPRPLPSTDRIVLHNNTGGDSAVVLLDGRRTGGCVNDEVLRGDGTINAGSILSNGTCRSEVAVFSDDNAMALVENVTAWTDPLGDRLDVNLGALLQAPITVWVLQGPFAATQTRATTDVARANFLLNTMNGGVGLTAAINDATNNPNTPALIDATCGNAASLQAQIGFTAGRLNAYYVRNPGGARGWWCGTGSNTIIVGATGDNESLCHEVGHSFSLDHTNGVTGMSLTNVMFSGGTGRDNLTEGQDFRCNVNPGSSINSNAVRAGPTRSCPDTTTSDACPALSLDVTPN